MVKSDPSVLHERPHVARYTAHVYCLHDKYVSGQDLIDTKGFRPLLNHAMFAHNVVLKHVVLAPTVFDHRDANIVFSAKRLCTVHIYLA